ncbi:hypothetical protein N9W12_06845 [Luminiphilus sp.]|nr:hypothetical protein [Luminiphilus sp.]
MTLNRLTCLLALTLTVAVGTSHAEPLKTHDQYLRHYETGFYSGLGAEISEEAESEKSERDELSSKNATEQNTSSKAENLIASEKEYVFSSSEKIGLETLFAQEAQKYRACIADSQADCYTDEIHSLQRLLNIYETEFDSSGFSVRSSDAVGRYMARGNGVFYDYTLEFSEGSGLSFNDICLEGYLKKPQIDWTPSDYNCRRMKAWGEYIRTSLKISLANERYKDIPLRITNSNLKASLGSKRNSPCELIRKTRCIKAKKLQEKREWQGLASLAEKYQADSYLWKYYKALAHSQLGETEKARDELIELLASFANAGSYFTQIEWEKFVRSTASLLVAHYYAIEDYESVATCCRAMRIDTSNLGLDDGFMLNAQLMLASALTLKESPNVGTALRLLLELGATLDRLDVSPDADIRSDLDQQLRHLLRQLDSIGQAGSNLVQVNL